MPPRRPEVPVEQGEGRGDRRDGGLGTYSLSCLASRMGIAPSSYHYARAAAAAPDRWAEARAAVVEEFEAGKRARGYRYVHERLRVRGLSI